MAKRLASLVLANLPLISLWLMVAISANVQSKGYLQVSEGLLRRNASNTIVPGYPAESKRRRAKGVAVAQLEIDESGNVAEIEVLEAPDRYTEEAMIKAVRQWKFPPVTVGGKPRCVRGKLTFYFVIEQGKATVRSPSFSRPDKKQERR
ncbi:MAG: energy transducer TonB [Blastocatellia bacterium]